MRGNATLAIVVSSACMMDASITDIVIIARRDAGSSVADSAADGFMDQFLPVSAAVGRGAGVPAVDPFSADCVSTLTFALKPACSG